MTTERKRGLRIGLAQIDVKDLDREANLAAASSAVATAAADGADLVVLPEMIASGFGGREDLLPLAEPRESIYPGFWGDLAREHKVGIVASFPELAGNAVVYNTTVALGRIGEPLAFHRKTHLYHYERYAVTPGDDILDGLFTFEGMRLGLLCCFEVEFPELARTLMLAGAQCLVIPTGNMLPWDRHHRVYIQARAMENQVFVAYCNRYGFSEPLDMDFPGESAIVDPSGRLVVDCEAGEKVVCADVDPGLIEESRTVIDYLRERRPEAFAGGC